MGMGADMQGYGPSRLSQEARPLEQLGAEVFDDEAFARAFDAAARQEVAEQEQGHELGVVGEDIMLHESVEGLLGSEGVNENRIGADLIHDPSQSNPQERTNQDDADALARTAAHLLDSVKDNQSEKFQNSQFLELMRQLRDKQVMVDGDKIVDTQAVPEEGHQTTEVDAPSQ